MPADSLILIVSAHLPSANAITDALTQAGYRVIRAAAVRDGRQLAARQAPHVTLLDADLWGDRQPAAWRPPAPLENGGAIALIARADSRPMGPDSPWPAAVDDVLPYPLAAGELTARVRLLRRLQAARAAARQSAQLQAAVARLGQQATAGLDPVTLYAQAAQAMATELALSHVLIATRQPGADELVVEAAVGWAAAEADALRLPAGPGTQAAHVLASEDPVLFTHLPTDARFEPCPQLLAAGILSGICLRIAPESGPVGIVAAATPEARRFGPTEASFLQAMAHVLMAAMQRQETEKAMRRSQSRYHSIFEGVRDAITVQSLDGVILEANNYACALYGYSRDEMRQMNVSQLVAPGYRPLPPEELVANPWDGTPILNMNRRASGELFPVELVGQILELEDETVVLVVARDITAREGAERALRQERDRAQTYLDIAGMILVALDEAFCVTMVNRTACQILGYAEEALLGRNWLDTCVPAAARDQVQPMLAALWREPAPAAGYLEHPVRCRDETERLVMWRGTRLTDVSGEPTGLLISGSDITAIRQAESALRESERRFRTTLENLDLIAVTLDPGGRVVFSNDALLTITGWERAAVMEQDWFDTFLPAAQRAAVRAVFERVITDEGFPAHYTNEIVTRDGARRLIAWNNTVQRNGDGRVVGVTSIGEDITERQQAEAAVRDSEATLRRVFQAAPIGIGLVSQDGTFSWTNDQMGLMLGRGHSALRGQPVSALYLSQAEFRRVDDLLCNGRHAGVETRWQRPDGSILDVWVSAAAVRSQHADTDRVLTATDITERKTAEAALRQSRERLSLVLDGASLGTWDVDLMTYEASYDRRIAAMLGYTPEQLRASYTQWDDLIHPADRETVAGAMRAHVDRATPYFEAEHRVQTASGDWRWYLSRGQVVEWTAEDAPARAVGVLQDIDERKQAEQQIARLAAVIEQASETVIITDLEGRIVYANPYFAVSTGYTPEDALGQNPRLLKSGHHDESFYRDLWETIGQGRPWSGRLVNRRQDGALYHEIATIFPIKDERGEIINYAAVKRDVTREVAAEQRMEQLLERQITINRLSLLLGETDDLPTILETIYRYVRRLMTVNAFFVSFFEEQGDQIRAAFAVVEGQVLDTAQLPSIPLEPPGQGTQSQVIRSGEPMYLPDLAAALAHNETTYQVNETESVLADASEGSAAAPRSAVLVPMMIAGATIGVLQVQSQGLDDYSLEEVELLAGVANVAAVAIRNAQLMAQLSDQARQVEQILNMVPEAVILLDADQRISLLNVTARAYLAELGSAAEGEILTQLAGRPLADLLQPAPEGLWHMLVHEWRTFNLSTRHVESGPARGSTVLIIRETTREREMQERAKEQDRLAAVGQLAAGIAHDFNNIMAVIVLYTQLALNDSMPQETRQRLQTIDQQARRAADLIQQILDFSRKSVLEKQSLALVPFVKELSKLLTRTLPETVQLELAHGDADYIIYADPTRIQQAIMNLALNARDAMPDGGRLHIELAQLTVPAAGQGPLPEMAPGSWTRLAVRDTGSGIPGDVLSHIYEPFFTTKAPGKGSGLGLAQVYGIVHQHDGHIDVHSAPGRGSTFTLYFPSLLNRRPERPAGEWDNLPRGQGQTILTVEDEPVTRGAIIASLKLLGYEALEAANGLEALRRFAEQGAQIDLVLSDAVMPEMGGIALLHALREQGITTPMIMLTGHPLDEEMTRLRTQGLNNWLPKPPSLRQLGAIIASTLQETQT